MSLTAFLTAHKLKELFPWVVVLLTGSVIGGYLTHNWWSAKYHRAETEHAQQIGDIKDARANFLAQKVDEWREILAADRKQLARLNKILEEERKLRSQEREAFQNALSESDLRKCDARGVASVLREKVQRERRRHLGPSS